MMRKTWIPCLLGLLGFSALSFVDALVSFGETRWTIKSTRQADLPVPNFGTEQTCCLVFDVDQDGLDDFVIGERTRAPALVWYKWHGKGWYRLIVDDSALPLEAGGAMADIDGDGDLDIAIGEDYRGNRIWWWENPSPEFGQPWKRRIIKDFGDRQHHDQLFGDFLGTGRLQLASWNQKAKTLLLFPIPQDPRNAERWESVQVYRWTSGPQREGFPVEPVDLDLDGKADLVGGGRWFKHRGGQDFEEQIIDERMSTTQCAVGQLIAGDRPEVVFSPAEEAGMARWYAWVDHRWVAHDLGHVRNGHTCQIADFDGDGHADIMIGEMGKPGAGDDATIFIWYGNGRGDFRKTIAWRGLAIHAGKVGDFNGDGHPDILVKPYSHRTPRLDVLLNAGPHQISLDRWRRIRIGDLPDRAIFISAADLDRDGHLDLVAGAWWWKNPGVLAGEWQMQPLGAPLYNMATVYDFDGDGHPDVLGTQGKGSETNRQFLWARNEPGGKFRLLGNVRYSGQGDFLQGCTVGLFPDGLKVFLSWHRDGGGISALNVPSAASKESWTSQLISQTVSTPPQGEDLALGDIDGDGDLDLLLGDKWLRNDGEGRWSTHAIATIEKGEPDRCRLVDLDRDGRLDVVVTLEKGTDVLCFEQPDSFDRPWKRHQIGTVEGQGFSMDVADFNADGWMDIVVGEHAGRDVNRVIVFSNPGSKGLAQQKPWKQIIIDEGPRKTIDHHDGTLAYDMDRDGDLDIISIGWRNPAVWVYENLNGTKRDRLQTAGER